MENQNHSFDSNNILREVLVGLSLHQKTLPPKFLYDKKGSEIFEKICQLDDYYPTRAEKKILEFHAREISSYIGEDVIIIEPGSGASEKIRLLLPYLKRPRCYIPIEISEEILLRTTEELRNENPKLNILPICADFSQEVILPEEITIHKSKKLIFFPGSTIGNFNPQEALAFLKCMSKMIDHGGGLLIGVDLKKDSETFKRAYDDSEGVTAEFNLNILNRLNRETDASFEIGNFSHEAFYNEDLGRVEMHLKSLVSQQVKVHESIFRFNKGETIHTENSYKYLPHEFAELCNKAKLNLIKFWMDDDNLFCVYYFQKAEVH